MGIENLKNINYESVAKDIKTQEAKLFSIKNSYKKVH